MAKREKGPKKSQKPLDTFSWKRGRGRPGVRRTEIRGRADNYRFIFEQIWKSLRDPLLRSSTEVEVTKAFQEFGMSYHSEFVPAHSALILRVIKELKFPKRPQAQIGFIADSLGAVGRVSPRRSRDICQEERKKERHFIVRQDYYIECTCHYKGPALHGKCPKCGTDELSQDIFGLGLPKK